MMRDEPLTAAHLSSLGVLSDHLRMIVEPIEYLGSFPPSCK
jgi:hypothetical protein